MSLTIEPTDPTNRPFFAGVVSGCDLTQSLLPEDIAAIHAGMDRFGVLVFRDQQIDDDQQLVFSRSLGPLEQATGDIAAPEDRRLGMDLNDISNLDTHNRVLARDDRRRLFGLGNQLWHSDSSFKPAPAKYSILSARHIPQSGGNTEFADMRAAYDALDDATKREIHDLICLHSQLFSRGILGFTDFTDAERAKWAPVRQRLVRRHPSTGRLSLYLSSHAGAIEGRPVPEARALLRDVTEHATQRQFVYAHVWRPHDLVMWDNRVTMHRARRYDHTEVRDMRRTTLTNEVSSLEQAPEPLPLPVRPKSRDASLVGSGCQSHCAAVSASFSPAEEAAVEDITADMKVAQVLRRCPETVDVFLRRGCPDMRRGIFSLMARLMSVRNAARIHKIELGPLLVDLNKVAQGPRRSQP